MGSAKVDLLMPPFLTGVQPCRDGCHHVFDSLYINWGLIIMEQCASHIAVSAEAKANLFCMLYGNVASDQKV